MKRFTIPIQHEGGQFPFHVYIGHPDPAYHPLHFQHQWLQDAYDNVKFPKAIEETFERLQIIADRESLSFQDLCVHALALAQKQSQGLSTTEIEPKKEEEREGTENPTNVIELFPGRTDESEETPSVNHFPHPDFADIDGGTQLARLCDDLVALSGSTFSKHYKVQISSLLHGVIAGIFASRYEVLGLSRVINMLYSECPPIYNLSLILDTYGGVMERNGFSKLVKFMNTSHDTQEALLADLQRVLICFSNCTPDHPIIREWKIGPLHEEICEYLETRKLWYEYQLLPQSD